MLLLANVNSAASAAEFAGLAVFFVFLAAIPTTIIVNLIVMKPTGDVLEHFKRGMIIPLIALAWAVVYQLGLWDALF